MNAFNPIVTLKLSIQLALVGEITDRLVSVTCGLKNNHIEIRAYVRGDPSEEDIEHIQFVGTEVIANFPEGYTISESCVSIQNAQEEMLDFWAFRRAPAPNT